VHAHDVIAAHRLCGGTIVTGGPTDKARRGGRREHQLSLGNTPSNKRSGIAHCVGLLTVRWWKHLQVTAFDSGDGVLVVDGDSGEVLQQGDVEGEVRAKGIR
jgi:hypothetical protein